MSDLDSYRNFLILARKDLKAFRTLISSGDFDPETVGFHAQQAVEKALKAWLSLLGIEYPKTHNLRYLIILLEETGINTEDLWDFLELSPFAIQYRYESYDFLSDSEDWEQIDKRIETLIELVEKHTGNPETK